MQGFNHNTMRKIAVVLMILCSLMVVPNSIGQNPTPTAAISTTCQSSNFSIFHLYDDNFDYNPNISNLSCTSTNPTAYQEKVVVDVDTGTNKIIANYPTVFYMEKDSQINFDISFFIFESYLMNIMIYYLHYNY